MRALALALAVPLCAAAADLPVRQVILYKNGVGYFERSGNLAGGESARLDFKIADMNDVLKSLVVVEKGAGKVNGVRYDSVESLAGKLATFPFQIDSASSLAKVLDQFRGFRVELSAGGQTVRGVVVSARQLNTDRTPEKQEATLLLENGDVRVVDLGAAVALKFLDAEVQQKFKDYLAAVAASRSQDRRSVYIDSTDKSSRELSVSYMAPMPAWKSSYRLVFNAKSEAHLEGWAIVDNITGDDWTGVKLALVSGRPVSFISRLYEPRNITRRTADLADDNAVGPVVYEGGVAGGLPGGVIGGVIAAAPPPAPAPMAMKSMRAAREASADSMGLSDRASNFTPAAARELGELFEYRFADAVSVRKNESVMLPFLQQKIAARKLLIYSDTGSVNPMTAAELSNDTGKTLDGGPITVFDAGAYAGEALVDTVKMGDKRLISYGLDQGTRVTRKLDSRSAVVREIRMNRGILITRSARRDQVTFTARNIDKREKTLVIEQPIRTGYTLLSPKATETTPNKYRFELKLPAAGEASLAVHEEYVYENSVSVANYTPATLATYISNTALSDAGRKTLERIAAVKRDLAAQDDELTRIRENSTQLEQDQRRVRDNIGSLNSVTGQQEQVQRYARQLSEIESQLAALRDQQSIARKKKTTLEGDLSHLIETASF